MSTLRPTIPGDLNQDLDDANVDKTMRPAEGLVSPDVAPVTEKTMRPAEPMTTPMVEDLSADGEYFILKGERYHNQRCLSDNSGEAQVFLVDKNGQDYVLKIYYPNFDVNKKLLQTIYNFDFEMVVDLLDYGKTYVDGKHRSYELMEYLHGGNLGDYHLNGDMDKFRRIALQGAAALAFCHNNNVLHKDVKPSNLFFRDKERTELVLGDFGISSLLEQDGKSHRTTQARTPIYAAPEMYSDVIDGVVEITPAADFYSLGMTLMALWLEGNPMSSNERVMMRQKNEGRLPRLNELPDRVKMIVQGLTSVNPLNRWGFDEVEKWFLGESPNVDISSPFLKYKTFLVDPDRNLVADNIHELIPLLVENEKLAIGYLYNGRIGNWLESCGNTKLSTIVKDIVVNRYPADQHAGLMASIYVMEPTYCYKDVKGNNCDDIHSVAMSMLSYPKEYGMLLTNPNDNLFLYLESHTKCNIKRLRSYFEKTETFDPRVAVMKVVYEIDPEIPLIGRYPSSTLKEIVKTFGREELSDDDWHSLTDGRLLSWMFSHEDKMACESLRILTQGQPYSKSLAYKVLYNLDREAAYDLRFAFTTMGVGDLLADRLMESQNLSADEIEKEFDDFLQPGGRFCYFAQLHGWNEILNEANRCFDFKSDENRERLGAYDARTALYRFCRILGSTPVYKLSDGTELKDGRDIDPRNYGLIRQEIRDGSFIQWMSAFYHEDPNADFTEEYAYEHTLEDWLNDIGKIDKTQTYYKRFVDARKETSDRVDSVRTGWRRAKAKENIWRWVFYALSGVWILLVLIFGVNSGYILSHPLISVVLPVGSITGIIVSTRAYFRGYGFFFSFLWGTLGVVSSFIPFIILKYISLSHPSLFSLTIVAISLVYMLVCHLTDFRGDQKADNKLINEVLDNDIKSTLLEPLYYTFKTKSYRFKGSKFGLLDDVTDQVRSISGESVLHYVLWSLLALILVADFIVYSPKFMNVANPNMDEVESTSSEFIQQIDKEED
ncbi:MAG: protein kinase [Prevotella sp.]|nr:protein kinase [Prevotella sp.]MBR1767476.1 protein kinase [Prevotella sp.]